MTTKKIYIHKGEDKLKSVVIMKTETHTYNDFLNAVGNYKIIFDDGKPYEVIVKGEEELKKALKNFYEFYLLAFNAVVLNDKEEDISESQFIEEIIKEIIK